MMSGPTPAEMGRLRLDADIRRSETNLRALALARRRNEERHATIVSALRSTLASLRSAPKRVPQPLGGPVAEPR